MLYLTVQLFLGVYNIELPLYLLSTQFPELYVYVWILTIQTKPIHVLVVINFKDDPN